MLRACAAELPRITARTALHGGRIARERGVRIVKSLLIADTTREERERIVAESIGNIEGLCAGCSPGLLKMYQSYIDGEKELREVNMEFNARYSSGAEGPDRGGCGFAR